MSFEEFSSGKLLICLAWERCGGNFGVGEAAYMPCVFGCRSYAWQCPGR